MTVKSLKKQLMAAIAMVLVSVLALSSATFAWFANNNKVTADGISITAKAEGKLLLIDDEEGCPDNSTSAELSKNEANAESLYPVHPDTETPSAIKWMHRYSDKFDTAVSGDDEEAVVTNGTAADDAYYYLSDKLYIRLADNGDDTITASDLKVTQCDLVDKDGKDLAKAARVLLVVDGTAAFVYENGKFVSAEYSADGQTAATTADVDSAVIKNTVTAKTDVVVDVYVYFEGRDENCTSKNFNTNNVAVTLAFEVTQ